MYTKKTFEFLTALKKNNKREWFNEHKTEYVQHVLEPSLAFIESMQPHLRKSAPYLTANPSRLGGSLTRIYRDTRFSADKTPYKTNIGMQFRHEDGADIHAPGVYVHIEPGECLIGAGCYRPDAETLKSIRTAIADDPKGWAKSRDNRGFAAKFKLWGESLKTTPRDFSKDHPMAIDLRRKDYIAVAPLKESDFLSAELNSIIIEHIKAAKPLMKFICESLDLSY